MAKKRIGDLTSSPSSSPEEKKGHIKLQEDTDPFPADISAESFQDLHCSRRGRMSISARDCNRRSKREEYHREGFRRSIYPSLRRTLPNRNCLWSLPPKGGCKQMVER